MNLLTYYTIINVINNEDYLLVHQVLTLKNNENEGWPCGRTQKGEAGKAASLGCSQIVSYCSAQKG